MYNTVAIRVSATRMLVILDVPTVGDYLDNSGPQSRSRVVRGIPEGIGFEADLAQISTRKLECDCPLIPNQKKKGEAAQIP